MSDHRPEPTWWQASDGKWYPPETHPDYRPPPPTATAPPPPIRAYQPEVPVPPSTPPPVKSRGCLPWVLAGVAVLAVLVAGTAVAIVLAVDADQNGSSGSSDSSDGDGNEPRAAGAADEIDDVGPCVFTNGDTITLELVNNSSKISSYVIDVNFLDDGGQRVGDDPFFVNFVRPDQPVREDHHVFDDHGGTDCEIAEVERFEAQSPDDTNEVTCEITGVDSFGDIEARFTASNGSTKVSDYFITAAFIRDDVRIGTSFGSIENVRPGESAPGDGFSTADGPADAVDCDIVHLQRTASE